MSVLFVWRSPGITAVGRAFLGILRTATIELDALRRLARKNFTRSLKRYPRAAAMINAAKRPVLYLGGVIVATRVRELAGKAQLPTTMTLMALGVILPKAHPLSLGMLGMHGARSTNY